MQRRNKLMTAVMAAALSGAMALPAAAVARDSDGDGMPNWWEREHRLGVQVANARGDADRDGLRNLAEFRRDGLPRDEDSDNDGVDDGDEVKVFDTDLDDANSDDDRVVDGDEDADGDGVDNEDEDDSLEGCRADDDDRDSDGIDDEDENELRHSTSDRDADDDGKPDVRDRDDDNDGIADVRDADGDDDGVDDGDEDVDDDGVDDEDEDDDSDDRCDDEDEDDDDEDDDA